jgi:capsular polysaccharide transport system ATP-binding protein
VDSPTITFNSVSKEIGRRLFKKLVLEEVNWTLQARSRIVILGPRNSGASALVQLIAGMELPTTGWIDRRAIVSVPGGLLRYARRETMRQLIARLSQIYSVDPKQVADFMIAALQRRDILDTPIRLLPVTLRQQVSRVLTYAFPCDFYVFNNVSTGAGGDERFQAFCQRAFDQRSKQAGIVMLSNSSKAARKFGDEMMGALVHQRRLTVYRKLSDAIAVFESLPPEESVAEEELNAERPLPEEEEFF